MKTINPKMDGEDNHFDKNRKMQRRMWSMKDEETSHYQNH